MRVVATTQMFDRFLEERENAIMRGKPLNGQFLCVYRCGECGRDGCVYGCGECGMVVCTDVESVGWLCVQMCSVLRYDYLRLFTLGKPFARIKATILGSQSGVMIVCL